MPAEDVTTCSWVSVNPRSATSSGPSTELMVGMVPPKRLGVSAQPDGDTLDQRIGVAFVACLFAVAQAVVGTLVVRRQLEGQVVGVVPGAGEILQLPAVDPEHVRQGSDGRQRALARVNLGD